MDQYHFRKPCPISSNLTALDISTEQSRLHRHLIGYLNPENKTQLLHYFRKSPVAPKRKINNQKVWEEIVYFQPKNNSKSTFSSWIYFPNGRKMEGDLSFQSNQYDFSSKFITENSLKTNKIQGRKLHRESIDHNSPVFSRTPE